MVCRRCKFYFFVGDYRRYFLRVWRGRRGSDSETEHLRRQFFKLLCVLLQGGKIQNGGGATGSEPLSRDEPASCKRGTECEAGGWVGRRKNGNFQAGEGSAPQATPVRAERPGENPFGIGAPKKKEIRSKNKESF